MILVTGGTGFIGRYLLHNLVAQGEQVRAIKRAGSRMPLPAGVADKIEWVTGDVLDIAFLEDAMQGCEKVYHCAAVVSFVAKDQDAMNRINIQGTANVVNACLTTGVKKLLHISSIAAIGRSTTHNHVKENDHWEASKLNTRYATSKHKSEMEVWRGIAEGLNAVIINPSVVLGPGDWNSGTCKFFADGYKGVPGYTAGITGFVDVRDVAKAMILLMNSNISGERFIANGENMPYKDLLFSIADAFGKHRPFIKVNMLMSEVAWRVFAVQSSLTGKQPLVTKETARIATRQFFYDNQKIKTALNFSFTPIAETIRWTCEEFLKEKQA